VRAADAETLTALVEKQRGSVFGAGPVVALVKPVREGGAQLLPHELAAGRRRQLRGGDGSA